MNTLSASKKDFIDGCLEAYASPSTVLLWVNGEGIIFHATKNSRAVLGVDDEQENTIRSIFRMSRDEFIAEHNKKGYLIIPLLVPGGCRVLAQMKVLMHSAATAEHEELYFISVRLFPSAEKEVTDCYKSTEPEMVWAASKTRELVYLSTRSENGQWTVQDTAQGNLCHDLLSCFCPIYQNIFQAAVGNCQLNGEEFSLVVENYYAGNSVIRQCFHFAKIDGRCYRSVEDNIEIVGEVFLLDADLERDRHYITADKNIGRVIIDAETFLIRECNQKAAQILGYDDPAQIIGKRYKEILPNADVDNCNITTSTSQKLEFLSDNRCYRTLRRDESMINILKSVKSMGGSEVMGSFINALDFPPDEIDTDKIVDMMRYLSQFSVNLITGNTEISSATLKNLLEDFRLFTNSYAAFIYRGEETQQPTYELVLCETDKHPNNGEEVKVRSSSTLDRATLDCLHRHLRSNQLIIAESSHFLAPSSTLNRTSKEDYSVILPLFGVEEGDWKDSSIPSHNLSGVEPNTIKNKYWGFLGFCKHGHRDRAMSATDCEVLKIIAFIVNVILRVRYAELQKKKIISHFMNELRQLRNDSKQLSADLSATSTSSTERNVYTGGE